MLGNTAVICGLDKTGCGLRASCPGTLSTEITQRAAQWEKLHCGPKEKVAFGVCEQRCSVAAVRPRPEEHHVLP